MTHGIRAGVIGALLGLSVTAWGAESPVRYSGTLISVVCVIDVENAVPVDLGEVEEKRLYVSEESAPVRFHLSLTDCDPQSANSVTITLQAAEGSATTDGYLPLAAGSQASGAVIGIRDPLTGERVRLGTALPKKAVTSGVMTIALDAYLRITPEAQTNQSIVPGSFSATLNYVANYE